MPYRLLFLLPLYFQIDIGIPKENFCQLINRRRLSPTIAARLLIINSLVTLVVRPLAENTDYISEKKVVTDG